MKKENPNINGILEITPVAPVHIGSGEKYSNFEIGYLGNGAVIKDVIRFIEDHIDNPQFAEGVITQNRGRDIDPEKYKRYALATCVRDWAKPPRESEYTQAAPATHATNVTQKKPKWNASSKQGRSPQPQRNAQRQQQTKRDDRYINELRCFIKDPFDQAYIPGSSVKGLIRTAIANAIARSGEKFNIFYDDPRPPRQPSRTKADQYMKVKFFSGDREKDKFDVIKDPFKALAIADSAPFPLDGNFSLCQVNVMNLQKKEQGGGLRNKTSLYVEAWVPGATPARLPFRVDPRILDNSLENDPRKEHHSQFVKPHLQDFQHLESALREFSKEIIREELKFSQFTASQEMTRIFSEWEKSPDILLPLGFGGGWISKTLGLQLEAGELKKVRDHYAGRGNGKNMGNPDCPIFPKTRKWAYHANTWLPMAWVKIRILQP